MADPAPPKGATGLAAPMDNARGIAAYWAIHRADAAALIADGAVTTYAELGALIVGLADALSARGVGRGDRIAILGENDVGVVAAIFAAWTLDAWAVPLNARYTERELDTILAHADPRIAIAVGVEGSPAAAHAARMGWTDPIGPGLSASPVRDAAAEPPPAGSVADADPREGVALILYTSGTTGAPKGVMLPHRAVLAMADLWAETRAVTPDGLVYQVLPLSHSYGLNSLMMGALNRGCAVELRSRFAPAALHDAFARGVAVFQGVPAMYARYLAWLEETGAAHRAPELLAISTGGSPLDPGLKTRVEAVFGLPLRQAFGMTEAGPTVTAPMPEIDDARSLGREIPGVSIRIVDADTGRDVDGDAPGEMWVRSPGVMLGYFRNPVATAAVLMPGGWLRTGDIVRRSPRGDLLIAGRARDIIIRSGFNVHPSEVEAVLCEHPAVKAAAVVGRAGADADEEVVAFVELRGGMSAPDDLAIHCAARLAGYKRPSTITVLDELPLNLSGKVATAALRLIANSTS